MVGVKYIASCSFGKDSLAMVLLLLAKKYPLDEVIFFDTGMEFQAIYNNRDKLSDILSSNNIKFSVLKDKKSFEYNAFQREVHKKMEQLYMDMTGVVDQGDGPLQPNYLQSIVTIKTIMVMKLSLNMLVSQLMKARE